jgi:hypothetical protein
MSKKRDDEHPERVAIPAGTSKVAHKAAIFPIAVPRIPDSVFPINSQEELIEKLSKLLVRKSSLHAVPGQSIKRPRS